MGLNIISFFFALTSFSQHNYPESHSCGYISSVCTLRFYCSEDVYMCVCDECACRHTCVMCHAQRVAFRSHFFLDIRLKYCTPGNQKQFKVRIQKEHNLSPTIGVCLSCFCWVELSSLTDLRASEKFSWLSSHLAMGVLGLQMQSTVSSLLGALGIELRSALACETGALSHLSAFIHKKKTCFQM